MYRGLLPPVILTLAVGYLLVLGASNRTLRWFFKPAPIVLLIVLAAGSKTPDTGYKSLLVAGLTASVLGDVFLLELKGRWFMAGLSSFLIAQVLYFSAFLTRARFGMITITRRTGSRRASALEGGDCLHGGDLTYGFGSRVRQ